MGCLTILSHNAFWFQGVPFRSEYPPGPDDGILRSLVALYRKIAPDVLCLQEIQSTDAFEAVCDQLALKGSFCPGRELPQYGTGTFFGIDECGSHSDSQCLASRVQRSWQTCEVSGCVRRLRICNVHLSSSRQLGPEKSAARRISELNEILGCCDGGPEVILGDFNEFPGGAVGQYMAENGYIDTAMAMNAGDRATRIRSGRGDYIWIKAGMVESLKEYNLIAREDFETKIHGKQYLSDHLPLWVVLEV